MSILQLNFFKHKQCSACHKWKEPDAFRRGRTVCKKCMYQEDKQRNAPRIAEVRAQSKQWHQQNKERYDERRKAWRKENKAKVNRFTQRRRALIRANGGSYTYAEWDQLCAQYDHRCLCCGEQKPLTPDHIVPVTKGGTSDIDNIQPLCMDCNRSKRAKIIDYRREVREQ